MTNRNRASYSEARLVRILQNESGLSARELAERIDIRPPSLTKILDRLEERGQIERVRDSEDSRVWRISLTEQGRSEMQRLREDSSAELSQAIENSLTKDEQNTFSELCDKLSAALSELANENQKGTVNR
ncbi:MAG: MarR family transcriptional regulator [Coriobacteriia bacterium]|nr:MarR family transcriptional regulator [Coriobacteriia bacterium]